MTQTEVFYEFRIAESRTVGKDRALIDLLRRESGIEVVAKSCGDDVGQMRHAGNRNVMWEDIIHFSMKKCPQAQYWFAKLVYSSTLLTLPPISPSSPNQRPSSRNKSHRRYEPF
jgi:hypothetical protein